jgi:hypothetical protein
MTLCLMPSEIFILSKIEYFKEQQVWIKFCFKLSKTATEAYKTLKLVGFALLATYFMPVICLIVPRPWRCRWDVPLNCQLIFNGLHGIISQKIELWLNLSFREEARSRTWTSDRFFKFKNGVASVNEAGYCAGYPHTLSCPGLIGRGLALCQWLLWLKYDYNYIIKTNDIYEKLIHSE